ncbi:succinic semialdehyde dehydrogenase [Streptomyces sp. CB03238]|uniref:succinic semialdehyde dehydrogenase n=1 Tax=Streptomyces sp. CB03238 TaxID=1907777 RepID=UPI000A10262F|nr:succinic semialdehyde dehydrogenase [Streptomyces sp. CB03238]ORT59113.1 succinic semialdehyde dehydrogenase [Streptomyces sp. CB03238]
MIHRTGSSSEPLADRAPVVESVCDPELVRRLVADVCGSGSTFRLSPFDERKIADIPESSTDDVLRAFAGARKAQEEWAAVPVRRRAQVLLRLHDLLLARQEEILDLVQLETGKTRLHALEEVLAAAVVVRHYGRTAHSYLRPRRRGGAIPGITRTVQVRHPVGVVGQIVPWNYPLALTVSDALPALAAGNAVVTKPDTQSALSTLWVRELLVEAGLPQEVWCTVIGEGPVVGRAVVEHADYVCFTGSTRTGREVGRRAADRLVGCSLELGGKNAMVVFEDADLDRAVDGALRGCFASAGQLCMSIERLYLHEAVAADFLAAFAERTAALRLGADLAYGPDMGSLVSHQQLRTVREHVEDAVAKGAEVLAGGRPRPDLGPLFHEPTVLTGVDASMRVFAEETFGPVVSVYRFADESEAAALANGTDYGLNASVWTRDGARGRAFAALLRTGMVNVNESYASAFGSVGSPMGGRKSSGLGRRHGAEGIQRFTESQTIAQQRLVPMAPFALGPLRVEGYAAFMTSSLRLLKRLRLR